VWLPSSSASIVPSPLMPSSSPVPVPGTIVPVFVMPAGPMIPVCWKTKPPVLPARVPVIPVVSDVAAAALGLGDHQLSRALALEIAAERPGDVDAAQLDANGLGVGLLVVAVVGEGSAGVHTSWLSASSTTSSCVFGEAFGMTWAILPSGSMMKVERSIPMYLFPYIDFSPQAP
jgi:hypothetical protein